MIQFGAAVLMVIGVLGKFGALFVCIPDPIVGGVFMVMFGMIDAVGISNLQFADMNSSRNLFIVGFAIVFGLALPNYMKSHPNTIETGMLQGREINFWNNCWTNFWLIIALAFFLCKTLSKRFWIILGSSLTISSHTVIVKCTAYIFYNCKMASGFLAKVAA